MKRTQSLRNTLLFPLLIVFGLLWLAITALLVSNASKEVEKRVVEERNAAYHYLQGQWETYENNLADGLGPQANYILQENLSRFSGGLSSIDGAVGYVVRNGDGKVITNQIAYGTAYEIGSDGTWGDRWYLTFDEGLDDEGQIALAEWIEDHRLSWEYRLYPDDSIHYPDRPGVKDPTGGCARITGIIQPGDALSVQSIEIIYSDGTMETMVETSTPGDDPVTIEVEYLEVSSWLLSGIGGRGSGRASIERRLKNYRAVQESLQLSEYGAVERSWNGVHNSSNYIARYSYGEYQILPYVLRNNWVLYLLLLLTILGAALLLSGYLSRKVTTPTEELCRQVEKGRCQENSSITELNTLARAVNTAQDKMAEQLQRERDFTRSAAHELKTPLAVLRAHAEALQEDIAPDKREGYLAVVLDETDRMAELTTRLLELSRLESGVELKREYFDFAPLVKEVFDRLALSMEQKDLRLELTLSDLSIHGDRVRISEAVGNLASNALRHCVEGGTVRVTLTRESYAACLSVYNDGSAIPEEDLPHLFEPFYRGDKSRSRQNGGTGLGLAILRATALAHGGSCGVENSDGGVTFTLRLPTVSL